ncbi:MAG: hypothetical protein J7L66_04045 [Anaerolineaceae bacterium]|nr:hypothetical protein [Anaerolineaceae bacterium]
MNKKVITILSVTAMLLTSCNALSSLGIGAEPVEKELELQEIVAEPTEAVVSESTYFRDELEDDPNKNWGLRVISGLEDQLIWSQLSGKLRLQTLPPNDINMIFFNKNKKFKDVIVQAEVENFGPLDNAFSLVCRANEFGWYEFRISSSGYYELLRYDQYLRDKGENAYTNFTEKRINSTLIKGGLDKNVFSLSCVGSTISAFINGEQLYFKKRPLAIEDDTYTEGAIGFGILGYGQELDMTFNWVEAVKP